MDKFEEKPDKSLLDFGEEEAVEVEEDLDDDLEDLI